MSLDLFSCTTCCMLLSCQQIQFETVKKEEEIFTHQNQNAMGLRVSILNLQKPEACIGTKKVSMGKKNLLAQTFSLFSTIVSHVWDVFGIDYSEHEVLSFSPVVTVNHKSHSSEASKPNVRFTPLAPPPPRFPQQWVQVGQPCPRCWCEPGT